MWLMGGTETLQTFRLLLFFFKFGSKQRCKQPTKCNNFLLLVFYSSVWICCTCFGRQTRPSSRALLTVYTALLKCIDIAADRWQGWDGTSSISNVGALWQSCTYSQKCSWRWASLSPETCRADSNKSIKRSINENCCIMLVAYIVVLMMHGLTNVKFSSRPLVPCWPGHRFDIFITDLLASRFFPRQI